MVPAQQRISSDWYRGTADAIYQNLNMVQDYDPKLVLVLAGDHVYKMDYRKLIEYHVTKGADMTVACVSMPKDEASQLGVVEVDAQNMVVGFQEKPKTPKTIPSDPNAIFGSMGIYLFNADVLGRELKIDADKKDSEHDFGKNIIPQMVGKRMKVFAYDFARENAFSPYWRDIGTRDSYYQTNMDLLGAKPKFTIYDKNWPLRTHHHHYPPVRAFTTGSKPGLIVDSLIASGCVVESAEVHHSVVSNNVLIKDGALVRNSVIIDGVTIGAGAQVQNAIIDKDVAVPAGARIGFNEEEDRKHFTLTTSGIVIVAKKTSL